MILRRAFLAGAAALAALPRFARADATRVTFSGSLEQGSLVVGKAPGASARRRRWNEGAGFAGRRVRFRLRLRPDEARRRSHFYFADGTRETRDVAPVVRQYEIQRINGLPQKFVTPPPEALARIKREDAMIVRGAHARHAARHSSTAVRLAGCPASSPASIGSQRILNGMPKAPHLGVDIAAPEGTPIHAPADAHRLARRA